MSLEVRFIDEGGEERRSSPARDVAFFWPQLVSLASDGLRPGRVEPWLKDYLDAQGVSTLDLLAAAAAYYQFCQLALSPDIDNPRAALQASGFFDCHPAAQLAVCAKLGQIVSGAFWAGIRSSTPAGKVPSTVQALREHAQGLLQELSGGRRRWRWLRRLFAWLPGVPS